MPSSVNRSSHSSSRCISISRASRMTKSISSWLVGAATVFRSHRHGHVFGPGTELVAHLPFGRAVGLCGHIMAFRWIVEPADVDPLVGVDLETLLRALVDLEIIVADHRGRRID